VLNDLVRSYMVPGGGVMPQFLQSSFDMLRDSQSQVAETMSAMNPMAQIPGFEAMKTQQEAFLKAMTGGMGGAMGSGWTGGADEDEKPASTGGQELDEIKKQLADLQDKLSRLK